jgi:hypothetical protein
MGFPTLEFNGTEGQKSTSTGGPDALETDLLELSRMFDPGSTLKSAVPGGIGTGNIQNDAVTTQKIANDSVTAEKLSVAIRDSDISTAVHRAAAVLDHPDGSILIQHLNSTVLAQLGGGTGIEFFADNALFSGSKKADALTWKAICVYATTNVSTIQTLTELITDKLKFGYHSLIVRMRSANNAITADVIKVEIFKNIGGSFVSQTSKLFKPTAFVNTTDYKCLYIPYEYTGVRATSDQTKVVVTLLTNATAFEVALDSITVMPSTIGIVG